MHPEGNRTPLNKSNAVRNLSKMYVEEFKENIADPLRREVRELRTEVNHLRNAIQKINDCPHSDACPVYSELQKQQDRHAADPQ